jgi:hypothetical protein
MVSVAGAADMGASIMVSVGAGVPSIFGSVDTTPLSAIDSAGADEVSAGIVLWAMASPDAGALSIIESAAWADMGMVSLLTVMGAASLPMVIGAVSVAIVAVSVAIGAVSVAIGVVSVAIGVVSVAIGAEAAWSIIASIMLSAEDASVDIG